MLKKGMQVIRRGDEVKIETPDQIVRGVVETAYNYGEPGTRDDWYIELRDEKGHIWYWKQSIDGGDVTVLYTGPVH